jgi:hypothetical protein
MAGVTDAEIIAFVDLLKEKVPDFIKNRVTVTVTETINFTNRC